MVHDYHEGLPGFSPAQILHDGCGECEARSEYRDHGISNLDTHNFERAWARAEEWQLHGLRDGARAEIPLLTVLAAVRNQFTRRVALAILQDLDAEDRDAAGNLVSVVRFPDDLIQGRPEVRS